MNLSFIQRNNRLLSKRWDIEVFFRFMKKELNLSHQVSLNKNGIEVMVYITMIASILLLIYKKIIT